MLLAYAAAVLDRDLRALAREVAAYGDERDLWRVAPGVPNSAGTLALHLAGTSSTISVRVWAGRYVRDRPAEFAERGVPRAELLARIEAARAAVQAAAAAEVDTSADFPEIISDARIVTEDYLLHLCTHFAFHLGQLDYHRRFVTGMRLAWARCAPPSWAARDRPGTPGEPQQVVTGPEATTSKSLPCTGAWRSWSSASAHAGFEVPVTYQALPWSARMRPYRFMAVSSTRASPV